MIDNLLSCGGKRSKKGKVQEKGKSAPMAKPTMSNDQKPKLPDDAEQEIMNISEKCAKILKDIIDHRCEVDKV